eukprot:Skav203519  [mRNA]  locus=scaffold687:139372:146857:+ [translate_table: standard]
MTRPMGQGSLGRPISCGKVRTPEEEEEEGLINVQGGTRNLGREKQHGTAGENGYLSDATSAAARNTQQKKRKKRRTVLRKRSRGNPNLGTEEQHMYMERFAAEEEEEEEEDGLTQATVPDADGDEMTAFKMTAAAKGQKMNVELLTKEENGSFKKVAKLYTRCKPGRYLRYHINVKVSMFSKDDMNFVQGQVGFHGHTEAGQGWKRHETESCNPLQSISIRCNPLQSCNPCNNFEGDRLVVKRTRFLWWTPPPPGEFLLSTDPGVGSGLGHQ